MPYILYSSRLDRPLARIDANVTDAVLDDGLLALPCEEGAAPDAVEHWREVAAAMPAPTPEDLLARAKARKLREINDACDAALGALTSTYPAHELDTFSKQESEARYWLSDTTVETPFLDALAAARGLEKEELVRRVLAKAELFAVTSGFLIGQRQRYEDQLALIQTVDEVEDIVPRYHLPEVQA